MKNKEPLVSVLIGTYNREQLIHRCLKSIFSQNYNNIEVIVVDDMSTDYTVEVLKEYKVKYPDRFKYVVNNTNKGIAYNSNLAYSLSSGQYLALIGDDDEWSDADKIKKQIEIFQKDTSIGLVSTWWLDVIEDKIVKKHTTHIAKDPIPQILIGNGVYCGSTALISKKAWNQINGFDENVPRGTDSDLFRRIILEGFKTYIIEDFTTKVYIDGHIRMTPVNSILSIKKDILSSEICLKKFAIRFVEYKDARKQRKKSLVKKYLRLIYRQPNFKNMINMVKIFKL